jgi:hypothetical protein
MRGFLLIVLVAVVVGFGAARLLPQLTTWWGGESGAQKFEFVPRSSAKEEPAASAPERAPAEAPLVQASEAKPAAADNRPVVADPPRPEDVLTSKRAGEEFRANLESVDRTAIGRLLAHEERYQELERYLNEGEGKQLPEAARKLASSFWLALNGQPTEAEGLARDLEGAEGVTSEQVALLRAGIAGERPQARAATGTRVEALALGMRMALLDRMAGGWARKGEPALAADAYSELVQSEVEAPWEPDREDLARWMKALNEAQEKARWNPQGSWPSISYEVRDGDSLVSIRKQIVQDHPELLLCVGLIRRANGLGERPIQPGQTLRIPTDPSRVEVDLGCRVLFYMQGNEVVQAWDVGIGMEGQETPTGSFTVGLKQENPSYMPVGGPSLPFGDPANPLGTRWIAWYRGEEHTGYGFHGTNDPAGVGARVSKGCVRMRNAEVEALFEILPIGAAVTVQQ